MDEDELRFVLGHEMGHVALGHTWLNTLLGGMAGVPVTLGAAVIVTLAFRWWNRACEYSADRAGLLACGKPQKAISALIKLVAGSLQSQAELQHALQVIESQDDSVLNQLGETLSTHPMIARRIEQIRKYAATAEYVSLQAYVNTNTK
jgi:Zn-dependent protease with chaperone function